MTNVHLTGRLICRDTTQAAIVGRHLPPHVELTLAESGCLSFAVTATTDPLVWDVEEWFTDETTFAAHQARVAASEWGRATAGIERSYSVEAGTYRQ
ncbi:MAG TPA: antibiotic biosynthesis monooxygenase [Plantibacter sp.]|uniref:putative quinol monooxygenase n=1 Tax=unclassified Plantibacter TaxID=2624265 RepID=UPI002C2984B0|nr:antibiotic biosynthesis monooxygenase [Plantibacter sp.]